MKNLILAMCCLVLLEGCKSSKKMEKQPAPKKTMVSTSKKTMKKPVQKSAQKSAVKPMQKSAMKKHETRKPAEKAGMQKNNMKKGEVKKSTQKPAQKAKMHHMKKSDKDKAVVQSTFGKSF